MKTVPISFTEEQYRRLRQEKNRSGCSMGAIVRMAIERYLSKKVIG
ncbi:MAG: ribbon-helix-helix protein, CopG family [Thermoplasmata archaeon]|nr:MAG: ribbon-helix-helix protein, CopG family [Thermoplasmata archaeon]